MFFDNLNRVLSGFQNTLAIVDQGSIDIKKTALTSILFQSPLL
ncbi:hypothetical protein SPAR5_1886 [Streptococcus pneumoniae GA04375]|nr:hypothetical protein SPAR5_1886 [Streptococcus pneumoniae GA04375]EHD26823.1 hypothetical protein SPAR98_2170 [Streptococcus pneumoniae GA47502]EHD44162.1 hypothetical protein SPAR110_1957 [Streptococcus pneumoniae GA49138]EHD50052.1 hypothetical protein SPAR128_1920 [Streptococcus pneumoniae 7286-06]EHD96007.1 hypothetical protein SPAR38_2043 [Streptococcus pneumoniae GA16121]EHE01307.1 hypothetical protein SPAR41_2153 [Streptococcus pneumoniae GA16833]EHE08174.1 hypothetical protein SPAR